MTNKVKLVIDEYGIGQVWLNDVEVEFVTGVEIKTKAQEPSDITIHIHGEVDAEIEVGRDPRSVTDVLHFNRPLTLEEVEDIRRRWNAQFKA